LYSEKAITWYIQLLQAFITLFNHFCSFSIHRCSYKTLVSNCYYLSDDDIAQHIAFEWVARAGNYVCKLREKQLMKKHLPNEPKTEFFTFIQKYSKLLWSAEAIVEGVSKVFAADQTGKFIERLGDMLVILDKEQI
jgi:hypothetical protein